MKLPVSWLKEYISVSLPADKLADKLTLSGSKVEAIEQKNGEAVIEIEVTTNRPDCLSLLGLAHEISALTGQKVRVPKLSAEKKFKKDASLPQLEIQDKKACSLYTARILRGARIQASPEKIRKALELMDARAIHNAVDATNFVLFETGQPLHAFDLDKIRGGVIQVRRSRAGEKFLALDGNEYTLDGETLVIADAERVIAIAGVIGGRLTEVTPDTKNILLESAYFDPALVRRASKKYKISTESSYRFERGVTLEGVLFASRRCADLILAWSGGEETGFAAKGSLGSKSKPVVLRPSRVERLLGVVIAPKKITAILSRLGFQARIKAADKIIVTPPPFRRDIAQEADLIEEIVRIEGFDKMPTAIPITRHTAASQENLNAGRVFELKEYVSSLGFSEIVTYSLLSRKALVDSGFSPENDNSIRKIVNAVSTEQEFFRPSLLPGMASAVAYNLHRKAGSLKFFEIGNVVRDNTESTVLALAVCGLFEESWRRKSEASLFDLKGVVENLLNHFKAPDLKPALSAFSPSVLKNWDIPCEVFYAELEIAPLLAVKKEAGFKVKPIPKFPWVRRDIAFLIGDDIAVADLECCMKKSGAPFLRETSLFDEYIGKNIPSGKRSLAFSLAYQKDSGTFTDDEIQGIQSKVIDALKNEYRVEMR